MGCSFSKRHKSNNHHNDEKPTSLDSNFVAMALINANRMAATLMVRDLRSSYMTLDLAREVIRRAKNDGQTVSVIDGCLYLDYKFMGMLPPNTVANGI